MTDRIRVLVVALAALVPLTASAEEEKQKVAAAVEKHSAEAVEGVPSAAAPTVSATADTGMEIHYTVESGVASTYVFRGVPQYLGKADPSIMTTFSLTLDKLGPGALTFGVWNATAVADYSAQPGTKLELDLTATYAFPIGERLTGSAGYILYLYPEAETVDGAHELWLSLSVKDLPVTPTLAVYSEFVRLKGAYIMATVSRTFELGAFSIAPWACVALSGYDASRFGLNDITVSLPVRWTHSSGFYASATVSYAYNGLLQDASFSDASTIYGLVVAGFSK